MQSLILQILLLFTWLNSTAGANFGPSRVPTSSFAAEEQNFLISYKAYITALIQAQAAETKKRLACLGYRQSNQLNPTQSADLENLFDEYQQSEECEEFLTVGVQQLFQDYSQMRIYLALHQANSNEVKLITRSQGSLGSMIETPWLCSRMDQTLAFLETDFCFSQIQTILNTQPQHLIKKKSLPILDKLLSRRDLKEVADLPALMWPEVVEATRLFADHYNAPGSLLEQNIVELQNNYDEKILAELKNFQKPRAQDILDYRRDDRMTTARKHAYYSALNFQASGAYVFSEFPEGSAPALYVEIVSQNPVLAFFDPPTENDDSLDCGTTQIKEMNLVNLCLAYKNSLRQGLFGAKQTPLKLVRKRSEIHQALIKAYLKILQTNRNLLEEIEEQYQSKNVFAYSQDDFGALHASIREGTGEVTDGWQRLISMESALDSFLQDFPEYQGLETEYVSRQRRNELWRTGGMIAGAFVVSLPCSFIGPNGYLACLLTTGLTANGVFYLDSLYRHDRVMQNFFATSHRANHEGFKMSLVEFASYRSEVQALYIDSLFMWVGIGGVPLAKATFQNFKKQFQSLPQLRRIQ